MILFICVVIADDVFKSVYQNDFAHLERYTQVTLASSKHALNDMNVQKLIHSKDLHFDLVINEEFCHEAWLMFAYKFNAPVITICKLICNCKYKYNLNSK